MSHIGIVIKQYFTETGLSLVETPSITIPPLFKLFSKFTCIIIYSIWELLIRFMTLAPSAYLWIGYSFNSGQKIYTMLANEIPK